MSTSTSTRRNIRCAHTQQSQPRPWLHSQPQPQPQLQQSRPQPQPQPQPRLGTPPSVSRMLRKDPDHLLTVELERLFDTEADDGVVFTFASNIMGSKQRQTRANDSIDLDSEYYETTTTPKVEAKVETPDLASLPLMDDQRDHPLQSSTPVVKEPATEAAQPTWKDVEEEAGRLAALAESQLNSAERVILQVVFLNLCCNDFFV